jgi:hypothetical protein
MNLTLLLFLQIDIYFLITLTYHLTPPLPTASRKDSILIIKKNSFIQIEYIVKFQ